MINSTNSVTTLLFDWDGTVVDSAQLGLTAFKKSFAILGIEFHQQTYEKTYSPNWYSMYEAMGIPKEKWDRADELWMQHYGEQTATLVQGAKETLFELRRKGYRLGVVSSGSDCRVGREIQQLGLATIFDVVVCNEHMVKKKPHPEGLETAMLRLNISGPDACYVGDSPEDIQMGKSANVLTVGVRSAYPTNWKVVSANPDIYLESLVGLSTYF
ncbi:MAG: HAD family hydrolase [Pyrinomonadaceae bacterium]